MCHLKKILLLFIYLTMPGLTCGMQDLRCLMQDLHCSAQTVYVHVHCGTWAPECIGSVVVVQAFSCSVTCGILVPQLGIERMSSTSLGRF